MIHGLAAFSLAGRNNKQQFAAPVAITYVGLPFGCVVLGPTLDKIILLLWLAGKGTTNSDLLVPFVVTHWTTQELESRLVGGFLAWAIVGRSSVVFAWTIIGQASACIPGRNKRQLFSLGRIFVRRTSFFGRIVVRRTSF